MSERPEMVEGTVTYWNGSSGWVLRDDYLSLPTSEQGHVMLRAQDVASGEITRNCRVTFEHDKQTWLALGTKVIDSELPPEPEPPPDSPPVLPEATRRRRGY